MGIVQDYLEDHFSTEVSEFLTIAVDSWSVLNSCVMLMSCILCCTRIQEKHKRLAVFSVIFSRLLFLVLKLILGGLTEPSRVVFQLDDVLHVFLHTCSYISARSGVGVARRTLQGQRNTSCSYLAATSPTHLSEDQDLMDEDKVHLSQEMRSISRSLSMLLAAQSGTMSPSGSSVDNGQQVGQDVSVKKE